jgi:integrase
MRRHFHVDTSDLTRENPMFSLALSELVPFASWLRKSGYRESTVSTCIRSLKAIARRTNLLEPESVRSYLASARVGENRKQTIVEHFDRFYKWKRIQFNRPRYRRIETSPFILSETEVDQLISGVGRKSAAFLRLIKETGCRPGEAWSIRWLDIDHERSSVRIIPEKNSRSRECRVSPHLLAMLDTLPREWDLVFHDLGLNPVESLDDFRRTFINQRKKRGSALPWRIPQSRA